MRLQGTVCSWNGDRGFGFVQWNGGGEKVFVHITAFENRRKPQVGDIVTYEVEKDGRGRERASRVEYVKRPQKGVLRREGPVGGKSFLAIIAVAIALVGIGAALWSARHQV